MHQVMQLFQCTEAEANTFLDGMLRSSREVLEKFLEKRDEASCRIRILNDSVHAATFATFMNNLQVEVLDVNHHNLPYVGPSTFEEANLIRNWSSVSTLSFTPSERTSEPPMDDDHGAQNAWQDVQVENEHVHQDLSGAGIGDIEVHQVPPIPQDQPLVQVPPAVRAARPVEDVRRTGKYNLIYKLNRK